MRMRRMLPESLLPLYERAAGAARKSLDAADRLLDRRTLDASRLRGLLADMGMAPGATVLVHSSMDQIHRRVPGLSPFALIKLMLEMIGPEGTLLMPTFPFVGPLAAHLEKTRSFDVRRTPSRAGLLSELFRRHRRVIRSLHPTHSVAGIGPLAKELLATHHLGNGFDEQSPFFKIGEHDGRVMSLGAHPKDSFTQFHVCESLHPRTAASEFEETGTMLTVIDGAKRLECRVRPHRADLVLDYGRAAKLLIAEGVLSYERCEGLEAGSARARRFIERGVQLIEEGRFYGRR
jgi:aminoglycoside 3-N-acetyltransferase